MDIAPKNSGEIANFHYIRYDPLRPTEELTQPYYAKYTPFKKELLKELFKAF